MLSGCPGGQAQRPPSIATRRCPRRPAGTPSRLVLADRVRALGRLPAPPPWGSTTGRARTRSRPLLDRRRPSASKAVSISSTVLLRPSATPGTRARARGRGRRRTAAPPSSPHPASLTPRRHPEVEPGQVPAFLVDGEVCRAEHQPSVDSLHSSVPPDRRPRQPAAADPRDRERLRHESVGASPGAQASTGWATSLTRPPARAPRRSRANVPRGRRSRWRACP